MYTNKFAFMCFACFSFIKKKIHLSCWGESLMEGARWKWGVVLIFFLMYVIFWLVLWHRDLNSQPCFCIEGTTLYKNKTSTRVCLMLLHALSVYITKMGGLIQFQSWTFRHFFYQLVAYSLAWIKLDISFTFYTKITYKSSWLLKLWQNV